MRRYLRLQQDLGGDEVIFDAPVDVGAAVARDGGAGPGPSGALAGRADGPERQAPANVEPDPPPARATDAPPRRPTGSTGSAVPIPAPGLVVASPAPDRWDSLDEIAAVVRECRSCPLCDGRTQAVPGEGNPAARLMVVGEGPGEREDLSGRPFVGRAGDLLNRMLEAIAVPRADAFIANVVKCRPPKNRVPLPDERAACLPYLRRQIELVRPRVLLALGGTAAEAMLGVKKSLGALRLQVHQWNGIPLIVTYHPAALLRNPDWKRPAWDDLRIVRQLLDRDA